MDARKYDFNRLSTWKERSLTNSDYFSLLNHISDDIGKADVAPCGLHTLYLLAANSKKIESHRIPADVVTINSEFIVSADNFQNRLLRVVFPENINDKNDISVYSAIGMACLGAKEKSYVYVSQSASVQKLLIEKIIFQPEREKLFYL